MHSVHRERVRAVGSVCGSRCLVDGGIVMSKQISPPTIRRERWRCDQIPTILILVQLDEHTPISSSCASGLGGQRGLQSGLYIAEKRKGRWGKEGNTLQRSSLTSNLTRSRRIPSRVLLRNMWLPTVSCKSTPTTTPLINSSSPKVKKKQWHSQLQGIITTKSTSIIIKLPVPLSTLNSCSSHPKQPLADVVQHEHEGDEADKEGEHATRVKVGAVGGGELGKVSDWVSGVGTAPLSLLRMGAVDSGGREERCGDQGVRRGDTIRA
ncbi:hypothetical protein C8F04DRAFT_1198040 [Mycena alexandri]|uniref:Uncharacterized protein n=1 Tax=Mycena alexandri TaxID=1745969 RepID=A0AAD6WND3_9AGAR|nr:hypothetical protein C8F04DRAFT_1198040 [Mycena alexandri]